MNTQQTSRGSSSLDRDHKTLSQGDKFISAFLSATLRDSLEDPSSFHKDSNMVEKQMLIPRYCMIRIINNALLLF